MWSKSEEESQRVQTQPSAPAVSDVERFETQRRQIQEALNQQTYHQFRAYAQQQFVGDPVQRDMELVDHKWGTPIKKLGNGLVQSEPGFAEGGQEAGGRPGRRVLLRA
ncbi:unnamed protein product [Toxocara canis]|uniref:Lipoprotein n=1 Tax=Toxocara canis TaxID=6265 RepID=A0A183UES2_TOXCA|nr:unnamed protein product [Toxocara canis]